MQLTNRSRWSAPCTVVQWMGLGSSLLPQLFSRERFFPRGILTVNAEPTFSQLDRLLPIKPCATPSSLRKLMLSIEAACVAPARAAAPTIFLAWGPLPTKIQVNCAFFLIFIHGNSFWNRNSVTAFSMRGVIFSIAARQRGSGVGNLRPAWTFDMARIRIFVTQVRLGHNIASKRSSMIGRNLDSNSS